MGGRSDADARFCRDVLETRRGCAWSPDLAQRDCLATRLIKKHPTLVSGLPTSSGATPTLKNVSPEQTADAARRFARRWSGDHIRARCSFSTRAEERGTAVLGQETTHNCREGLAPQSENGNTNKCCKIL